MPSDARRWEASSRSALRGRELDGEMLDRGDERVGAALGVDTVGNVDVGQSRQQLFEQNPDLGAGEVRAEAEMRSGPEREVQVGRAIDVERVGIVEHVGVAI